MITLPKDFVSTRHPGYYWNHVEKKLYSLKVTGELRQLSFFSGGFLGGRNIEPGYKISVKGIRRKYTLRYLMSLKPTEKHEEINVVKKNERTN